jgi:hypothetical protein
MPLVEIFLGLAAPFLYIYNVLPTSVADPHRKNADADPGKNLKADADSCPY